MWKKLYLISTQLIKLYGNGAMLKALLFRVDLWRHIKLGITVTGGRAAKISPVCSFQNYPDGVTWTILIL